MENSPELDQLIEFIDIYYYIEYGSMHCHTEGLKYVIIDIDNPLHYRIILYIRGQYYDLNKLSDCIPQQHNSETCHMSEYTEASIWTPERLMHIRLQTTMYFNSTGIEGLLHQALELITNAIDEIALMAELLGTVSVMLCIDAERGTYQLVVKDTGRGLPIGKLLDSYTKLLTSGKFDQGAYEHSGGLFGVGAKASAATARDLVAITHRPDGSAAIRVHEGTTDEVVELITAIPQQTGVTVAYEPDPIIFPTDIPLFAEEGQAQLILILQKYCFFHRLNIEFRVHPLGLPSSIWKNKIPKVEAIIEKYWLSAKIVFSEATFDRAPWIRSYFGIQRPFSLQHTIHDIVPFMHLKPTPREVMMRYEVRFYVVKFDTVGGRFGMVNNVGIDDTKSTHFATIIDALKIALSHYIKDAPVRKFFLDQYRLSIYIAVDIKFPGAAFSGTTKVGFVSKPFRAIYEPSILQQLTSPESVVFISNLYQDIAVDIENKYTIEVLGVTKVKNYNRLFEEFKGLSNQYLPCSTTNRLSAELFLVEGNSAGGGGEGRNSKTQALFMLRGKPFNGISDINAMRESAIVIRQNDIYKKILAITGINPAKFDPSSHNFGKILLLTDADNE
jgi:DNA gyrase/topoisomerase IV subunit B